MHGNTGNNNGMWKDSIGYSATHDWVKRHKPKPEICEECRKKSTLDLANISGEYKRDITDFRWLCRRCHMKSDGRMNNLKKNPSLGIIECQTCHTTEGRFKKGLCQKCYDKIAWQKRKKLGG